jgi:hypothetical protein
MKGAPVMPDSAAWVILTDRYGADKRQPSPEDLRRAIDELLNENIAGMTEADFAEHPNAWLRYGFDEGPMFVINAYRNGSVTFSQFPDQDDAEPLTEHTAQPVDRTSLLSLWTWLAEGDIAKIAAKHPCCGW